MKTVAKTPDACFARWNVAVTKCGGKGGKPGPCPGEAGNVRLEAGYKNQEAKRDLATRRQQAYSISQGAKEQNLRSAAISDEQVPEGGVRRDGFGVRNVQETIATRESIKRNKPGYAEEAKKSRDANIVSEQAHKTNTKEAHKAAAHAHSKLADSLQDPDLKEHHSSMVRLHLRKFNQLHTQGK